MEASQEVADAAVLVENTGLVQQAATEPANPYMDMFLAVDISSYSEVLYSKGLG